jgi:hypothetical protein
MTSHLGGTPHLWLPIGPLTHAKTLETTLSHARSWTFTAPAWSGLCLSARMSPMVWPGGSIQPSPQLRPGPGYSPVGLSPANTQDSVVAPKLRSATLPPLSFHPSDGSFQWGT